ncbi:MULTISPECIES: acyl-CoA dehydrogenase [Anaerococcus]|jgi:acyl-coA dehydrogenase domain protein|uniref:Acyl-CoA dehydrogenase n=1 Tax=Anaerococcus nagyae TaxID=1755241 RepID=A0A3E2THB2_9FIRM|nr:MULTISPECIES: acyl-CoA dehydrogenase [Anaerococcus]MBP2069826.1 butyryl-CoA dehydrogenase [Anaerococcus nagyae]MDU1828372.1 acyl-CoA dehydrogenase [Anaerococcus sp.]MDU1863726.1 acyl-CoA dehydrogenase [Anaerococcus sp.]MDU2353236.1 acyl-CoA dehydrogenase [Anaerococcus sp.]MDU2565740.1 acyl-CoA dehydrogenase [Anaerococcus sp.]
MYKLTEDQLEMQQMFRDFAEKEVAPKAIEVDEEHKFPEENVKKMQELGFFGIPFDEEYGGIGLDTLTYILAVEELSKACGTTGVILSAHTSLCADCINKFGTDEQKEKYLTPLASGESIGAFALTEPDAGTDAAGQKTVAVLDGDHYVLNGSKIFITNAGYADTYVVFAMTDKSQGTRGISAFIVEKDFEGFKTGTIEDKMGIKGSSTRELIFTDCKVPKENLLLEEGKGFKIAMQTLDGGRIGIAAQALGIAEGALAKATKYVKEREQFGRPLAKFQNTQFKLAEMAIDIESARHLVYKAATLKDEGESYTVAAATAKLKAARVAMDVTTKAVQILGGYGYIKEYEVERMMRDAKITEIYEGTSEVMLMVVAGDLLK